ncbi:hypothetical protein Pan216_30120 [Planctomycetes bacterium Pan216]|uniref:Uncharacterized protein n=1 Tax=Kolteria novifilia TaxID=2527975 RepID=A0A518B5A8_9BACT|nr:hypothetical protein Pan216_30120 [Planctomycetes bacterium Pan216]
MPEQNDFPQFPHTELETCAKLFKAGAIDAEPAKFAWASWVVEGFLLRHVFGSRLPDPHYRPGKDDQFAARMLDDILRPSGTRYESLLLTPGPARCLAAYLARTRAALLDPHDPATVNSLKTKAA